VARHSYCAEESSPAQRESCVRGPMTANVRIHSGSAPESWQFDERARRPKD
jgi:hypothetical protein